MEQYMYVRVKRPLTAVGRKAPSVYSFTQDAFPCTSS